jgi:hypothetical protein
MCRAPWSGPPPPRPRFVRQLAYPPGKALAHRAEHLKAWFPDTIIVHEWSSRAPARGRVAGRLHVAPSWCPATWLAVR